MANQTITADTITVHGRGSLVLPFDFKDASGTPINISSWALFFEVDGLPTPIREPLVSDPNNPLGKRIILTRDQIALLSKSPSNFALVDETNLVAGIPNVLWEGTIKRNGFLGAPDSTPEAGA